jgi:beta-glucosidase
MCAYNRVNGVPACESSEILDRILRREWRFRGFITSDWGALRSPQALLSGVDLEMPGREVLGRGGPYFGEPLAEAIGKGQIPVSALDAALTRILSEMDRFGMLKRKAARPAAAIDIVGHAGIAREIAEQGAVLLKNDGDALPLTGDALESLVVIGPTARQLVTGYMTERGSGFASRQVSPLEALRRQAPGHAIDYFAGSDLTGLPLAGPALSSGTHRVREMDFGGSDAMPPGTDFSWSGTLTVDREGEYTFMVQTAVGGGARGGGEVLIGGRAIVQSGSFRGFGGAERPWSSLVPTIDGLDNARATVHLAAGSHQIEIRAASTGRSPMHIRFAWVSPSLRQKNMEAAVAAAARARAAVVFAWHEPGTSLSLPEGQDELISRVAAANSRTIVVVNAGGPVLMPWRDAVEAVLLMWYPGQEGGWATANLLLGRANPRGRLPITFPAKLEDTPTHAPGHGERGAPPARPGTTGVEQNPPAVFFTEGLAVGYRWYDQEQISPLFAFGHGLSYTRFEYSDLRIQARQSGYSATFTLRNSGARSGSEVAQLYLGPPAHPAESRPPQWLAGFARVELDAGQQREVTMHLSSEALSVWSSSQHRWAPGSGERAVFIGASSRDIRLRGKILVTAADSP